MANKTRSQENRYFKEAKHERERSTIKITNGGRELRKKNGPPKLEVSINAEFMMSSVYAKATFGVFTLVFPWRETTREKGWLHRKCTTL
jgi:hypothetical protein